jgi:hypothetical protein
VTGTALNATSCVRPEACDRIQRLLLLLPLLVVLLHVHCKHGRPSSYVACLLLLRVCVGECLCVCVANKKVMCPGPAASVPDKFGIPRV